MKRRSSFSKKGIVLWVCAKLSASVLKEVS
jgi:hypothetical protein